MVLFHETVSASSPAFVLSSVKTEADTSAFILALLASTVVLSSFSQLASKNTEHKPNWNILFIFIQFLVSSILFYYPF